MKKTIAKQVDDNTKTTGAINTMKIAAVLLAIVSWWATARGMQDYVFEKGWQANLASLGIQGILLGLNFYLISFFKNRSVIGRILLVFLTLIVLACSSWFSYVHIVDKAYETAGPLQAELGIQSVYRRELYAAEEHTSRAMRELRNKLMDTINDLNAKYDSNKKNDDAGESDEYDENHALFEDTWGSELEHIMKAVRDDVLRAVSASASQKEVDDALAQIENAQNSLDRLRQVLQQQQSEAQNEIGRLEGQIKTNGEDQDALRKTIETCNNRIMELRRQMPVDEDGIIEWERMIKNANDALVAATNKSTTLSTQKDKAQEKYDGIYNRIESCNRAIESLTAWSSLLNKVSLIGELSISGYLKDMQKALLAEEIEIGEIIESATEVFLIMKDSSDDTAGSQELLNILYRFIEDARKYNSFQHASEALDKLLAIGVEDGIADTPDEAAATDEPDADGTEEPLASPDSDASAEPMETDTPDTTESAEPSDPEATEIPPLPEAESKPKGNAWDWMDEWRMKVDELRSIVSKMPEYSIQSSVVLSELPTREPNASEMPLLSPDISETPAAQAFSSNNNYYDDYSRSDSMDRLDNGVLLYLSDHNKVEKAILYLFGNNLYKKSLAWFAIVLAVLIDTAAFVVGVVSESGKKDPPGTESEPEAYVHTVHSLAVPKNSPLRTYVFLTGSYDFNTDANDYCCEAITAEGMLEIGKQDSPLQRGMYRLEGTSTVIPVSEKALTRGLNGHPGEDGVFCSKHMECDNNMICEVVNGNSHFIANIDDNTPVYKVVEGKTMIRVSKRDIGKKPWNTVILALDESESNIAAVYLY